MPNRKKTVLRKKNAGIDVKQSLIEFINDRIASLISDELDTIPEMIEFSTLYYEPVWTRKLGEAYIKNIRLGKIDDIFPFRVLDICIVEAYSLEMEDIVEFLRDNGSKKIKFKRG